MSLPAGVEPKSVCLDQKENVRSGWPKKTDSDPGGDHLRRGRGECHVGHTLDALGNTTTYEYHPEAATGALGGRIRDAASGVLGTTGETYAYDGLSRLTSASNDDATVTRSYDSLSRLVEEIQNGKSVKYGHDPVNNVTSIQYPNQRIVEREFDQLNRIARVKLGGAEIASLGFIGRGYRLASKGTQNGDLVKYLYDAGRRLAGSEARNKNDALIRQYAYVHDALGQLTYEQRVHDANKGDVYAYDALRRLKAVGYGKADPTTPGGDPAPRTRTFTLDKLDNILKIVDNENEVVKEMVTEMDAATANLNQYSRFGEWALAYDGNGNTTQKGTQRFGYDYRNRLVRGTDGSSTMNYTYDVFGRQTGKSGGSDGTLHFYYAGDQKIEERNGSDQVTRQYIWGNGIDELLRFDVFSGATATPYYVHTNAIGSTTAITDANGALVEQVSYDAYGVPTLANATGQTITSSSIGNTTLFQGREYDFDLALYNYRARYYDPRMGRFLQTDPLGYHDSMNLYQGMGLNPVNYTDPMGDAILIKAKNFSRNEIIELEKDLQLITSDKIKINGPIVQIVKKSSSRNKPKGTRLVRDLVEGNAAVMIQKPSSSSDGSWNYHQWNEGQRVSDVYLDFGAYDSPGMVNVWLGKNPNVQRDKRNIPIFGRPYFFTIAHELIHAHRANFGYSLSGKGKARSSFYTDTGEWMTIETNIEELETVGIFDWENCGLNNEEMKSVKESRKNGITENDIRMESNIPGQLPLVKYSPIRTIEE